MDLFRVQGRWGPSVRLAWIRIVLKSNVDVCGGSQLSRTAVNTFPSSDYFQLWAEIIDQIFKSHVNNIIKSIKSDMVEKEMILTGEKMDSRTQMKKDIRHYQYKIDKAGERQFLKSLLENLGEETEDREREEEDDDEEVRIDGTNANAVNGSNYSAPYLDSDKLNNYQNNHDNSSHNTRQRSKSNSRNKFMNKAAKIRKNNRTQLNITDWNDTLLLSVLHTALRGFFLGDLYTAMTEFLSRAEGSFGLQVK